MVPEFQGEQRQEIISGHPRVTQDKPTSSLLYSDIITQTAGAKQQDDGDFVKGMRSTTGSCLEQYVVRIFLTVGS